MSGRRSLDAACIRLPAGRSKVNEPRIIPLSPLAHERAGQAARRRAVRVQLARRQAVRQFQPQQGAAGRADRPPARRGRVSAANWPQTSARTPPTRCRRGGFTICAGPSRPDCSAWASGWRSSRPCSGTCPAAEGIVGVYQRHRFDDEAREALAAWGAHVQRLIDGDDQPAPRSCPCGAHRVSELGAARSGRRKRVPFAPARRPLLSANGTSERVRWMGPPYGWWQVIRVLSGQDAGNNDLVGITEYQARRYTLRS